MGKSHRVSRLLEIVTLLQSEEGWTASALAERFGISRTRMFSDIRALREAGVPVERGPSGYRIADSFFLPSVRLSPREVLALLFPLELFTTGEAQRAVQRSARDKLLSCLPAPLRDGAELNLAKMPASGVTVVFEPESKGIRAVRFHIDGKPRIPLETGRPYSLMGDERGVFKPWKPRPGTHSIAAAAYRDKTGRDPAAESQTVRVRVVDRK